MDDPKVEVKLECKFVWMKTAKDAQECEKRRVMQDMLNVFTSSASRAFQLRVEEEMAANIVSLVKAMHG